MAPIIRILAAASICLSFLVPFPAHAQWVTFTMGGVVDHGRDDLNLFFGEPGEVVFFSGEPYVLSLTFDTADFRPLQSPPEQAGYWGGGATIAGALTMNDKTFRWNAEVWSASILLERVPEYPRPSNRQGILMNTQTLRQEATGNRGILTSFEAYAYDWPLLDSLTLDQDITFPEFLQYVASTTSFEAIGRGPQIELVTWFRGMGRTASWTVSPVPEPGQLGMLAAGLAVLFFAGRRRAASRVHVARESPP